MSGSGPVRLVGRVERAGLQEAVRTVVRTLGVEPAAPTAELLVQLETVLAEGDPGRVWLALAVLTAELPDEPLVLRTVRAIRLDGAMSVLGPVLARRRRYRPRVEVRTGQVLVDVHHTAQTELATGIQRVARRTVEHWHREHALTLVGWTLGLTALRPLEPDEVRRALHGGEPAATAADDVVVVPWRCRYVLPELMSEPERAGRLLALLRFSGTRGSMIGFDGTPVSSAETVATGMSAGFTAMLGAMAWGDRLAAISSAAAGEFDGWRAMLVGVGLTGPAVAAIPLATEPTLHRQTLPVEANDEGPPLVLCVGSHEPRKNHLAVLAAAEVLWDEGLAFSLTFVGGNSWRGEEFLEAAAAAAARGRPVRTDTAISDAALAAAYRRARCTVFPSWNEGFGLPVAESLAAGTPVLTSRFGSMAEIARSGGAVLVDPRDDAEITDGLRRLLTDDADHARLSAEARAFPVRTWEQYATETWEFLVPAPTAAVEPR